MHTSRRNLDASDCADVRFEVAILNLSLCGAWRDSAQGSPLTFSLPVSGFEGARETGR